MEMHLKSLLSGIYITPKEPSFSIGRKKHSIIYLQNCSLHNISMQRKDNSCTMIFWGLNIFSKFTSSAGMSSTKLSGNTPTFPLSSPFHQPASSSSLSRITIISFSFKLSSSSLSALYEYRTTAFSTAAVKQSKMNGYTCK